jgi:cation diffusion facilitator family transporter
MQTTSLQRFLWLSIAAAMATIGLKSGAYWLTGSVGLLSDALESLVNLVAALMALFMVTLATRPPDEEHSYGHTKAEYFSSGLEGALILVAAVSIGYTALDRLRFPQAIEQVGLGVGVSVVASLINLVVARVLFRAGRHHGSIALEADAQHLMTDVWTSVGVLLGVFAVSITGLTWIDPIVALAVAGNIVWTGFHLMRQSALGLMDTALPERERSEVQTILDAYQAQGIEYHSLRTRQAGRRRFLSVHILVPGAWTVQQGHNLLEEIEQRLRQTIPNSTIFTHLEPIEDPLSQADRTLDRPVWEGVGE